MPNGPSNTHFWTTDANGELLFKPSYKAEGIAFYAFQNPNDAPDLIPVHRFFEAASGRHFWTTDANGELLNKQTWRHEGPTFFVPAHPTAETRPVYRFYDDAGHHFWTLDPNGELLGKPPFHLEGPTFNAFSTQVGNSVGVWRFHSSERTVGMIIQEGKGYKEITIGAGWQWIDTYINLNIKATVCGEPGRPFEIASGFVFPWDEVGTNKKTITGRAEITMGPLGALYVRSVDGHPMVFAYKTTEGSIAWSTPSINF